jgi:hypothetical protein
MGTIHMGMKINGQNRYRCHAALIIHQAGLARQVPPKSLISTHDEFKMARQRLTCAQHLFILRGVGFGQFAGKKIPHGATHDVTGGAPDTFSESGVDIYVSPISVLGRGHHLGQPIHQLDESCQRAVAAWYFFDTHTVTVAQDSRDQKAVSCSYDGYR